MLHELSSDYTSLQKALYPLCALGIGSTAAVELAPWPMRVIAALMGIMFITQWWTIVLRYKAVFDDGLDLLVGVGAGQLRIPRTTIASVERIALMRTNSYKVTAVRGSSTISFYFCARWGVTEEVIRFGSGVHPKAE